MDKTIFNKRMQLSFRFPLSNGLWPRLIKLGKRSRALLHTHSSVGTWLDYENHPPNGGCRCRPASDTVGVLLKWKLKKYVHGSLMDEERGLQGLDNVIKILPPRLRGRI